MELSADPVVATLEMSEIKSKDGEPSDSDGDYESLPHHVSMTTHMTAGAVAGILEHTVMYPVDSVKVQDPLEHTAWAAIQTSTLVNMLDEANIASLQTLANVSYYKNE